jgi:hypothetical protein
MPEYEVVASLMDVVDKDAGEFPDGRPKKVNELHRGDTFDASSVDEDRLKVLIAAGAIKEKESDKSEPAADTPTPADTPAPASGTTKKTTT